jgi:hypothetical protein
VSLVTISRKCLSHVAKPEVVAAPCAVDGCTMIVSLTLLSLGIACLAAPAWAEGTPARKPGLWEMSTGLANSPLRPLQYCLDAATDAALQRSQQADADAHCSKQDIHRDGNVVTFNMACRYGDTEAIGQAIYTISGETADKIVIKTKYNPPLMGRGESIKTWQWLGGCPADMQPGDADNNGLKMNAITGEIKSYSGKPLH